MTALLLRWRQPDPPVVTRWRGVDAAMLAAVARTPAAPIAAVIGAPGPAGPAGPSGPAGPAGSGVSGTVMALVEVNLAAVGRRSGRFVIGGLNGQTAGRAVAIAQASGPYSGKGTLADEAEMDAVDVVASVTSGTQITAYWRSRTQVRGNHKFSYQIGG